MASGTAFAADLPSKAAPPAMPMAVSPWDWELGGGFTTDYIFRGITQSNHSFGVAAHGELRYNINDMFQLYAGVAGESVKLTPVDINPSMELDTYGGVRGAFGNFTADLGVWGYLYPGLSAPTPNLIFPTQIHWVEFYGKLGYAFNDVFSIGANYFYTPSYIHTGAEGSYLSGTAKITLPQGFAISGELGYQWLGVTDATHFAVNLPDYAYWNVGVSYTYKMLTFDLRYHDTDLSKSKCFLITGPTGNILNTTSNYCDARVVGTVSFAFTSKDFAALPGAAPVVAKY
jgi:uncharacterized protein (TIGR02001 family)